MEDVNRRRPLDTSYQSVLIPGVQAILFINHREAAKTIDAPESRRTVMTRVRPTSTWSAAGPTSGIISPLKPHRSFKPC